MTEEANITGTCICGAVSLSGASSDLRVSACHCDMCRRWSSGPFFGVNCKDVTFEGADSIARIRSSDWAERGFCNQCGSNLFYHLIDSNEYQIAAGLLNDQSGLRISLQVFIDRKPTFYSLAQKTKTMTGAEIYAAYAPPPD